MRDSVICKRASQPAEITQQQAMKKEKTLSWEAGESRTVRLASAASLAPRESHRSIRDVILMRHNRDQGRVLRDATAVGSSASSLTSGVAQNEVDCTSSGDCNFRMYADTHLPSFPTPRLARPPISPLFFAVACDAWSAPFDLSTTPKKHGRARSSKVSPRQI